MGGKGTPEEEEEVARGRLVPRADKLPTKLLKALPNPSISSSPFLSPFGTATQYFLSAGSDLIPVPERFNTSLVQISASSTANLPIEPNTLMTPTLIRSVVRISFDPKPGEREGEVVE